MGVDIKGKTAIKRLVFESQKAAGQPLKKLWTGWLSTLSLPLFQTHLMTWWWQFAVRMMISLFQNYLIATMMMKVFLLLINRIVVRWTKYYIFAIIKSIQLKRLLSLASLFSNYCYNVGMQIEWVASKQPICRSARHINKLTMAK